MATPTLSDMQTSLEDARFFYQKLEPIIRGPEQGQELVLIRRYFRAFLHCWKCVPHFVREVKGLSDKNAWIAWCKKWAQRLNPGDYEVFECLRTTRDQDTHEGMIEVGGEIAAGLFPIVMFQPGKGAGPRRELISCCDRGLFVADHLIREHPSVSWAQPNQALQQNGHAILGCARHHGGSRVSRLLSLSFAPERVLQCRLRKQLSTPRPPKT